ncbi:hypothetical protein [Pseudomonas sp. Q11]|uniref:hypothetical protein n=1 Tax=Pseudomonas sp. Q11 TaxID=2968470 RepID=UPI00210EB53F|nr:hypothetical protein [Pseudomonas sp. Q11]MCQ6256735.1 hypothetical protein [Pseudomonas sp. Q11]
MSHTPRSLATPYTLSFSQDCMDGRLAPFSAEVESRTELAVRTVTHAKDELNHYVALVERPYAKLNRVIAQMAGLLILGQADNGFSSYAQLARTPEQDLIEVLDLLGNLKIPAMASAHFNHLSLTASRLLHIARELQRNISAGAVLRERTPALLKGLNNTNAMLRCASSAQLGLMPVDLKNTCFCCSQH